MDAGEKLPPADEGLQASQSFPHLPAAQALTAPKDIPPRPSAPPPPEPSPSMPQLGKGTGTGSGSGSGSDGIGVGPTSKGADTVLFSDYEHLPNLPSASFILNMGKMEEKYYEMKADLKRTSQSLVHARRENEKLRVKMEKEEQAHAETRRRLDEALEQVRHYSLAAFDKPGKPPRKMNTFMSPEADHRPTPSSPISHARSPTKHRHVHSMSVSPTKLIPLAGSNSTPPPSTTSSAGEAEATPAREPSHSGTAQTARARSSSVGTRRGMAEARRLKYATGRPAGRGGAREAREDLPTPGGDLPPTGRPRAADLSPAHASPLGARAAGGPGQASVGTQVGPTKWTRYFFPRITGGELDSKSNCFYSYFDVMVAAEDIQIPAELLPEAIVGRNLVAPSEMRNQFTQLYYQDVDAPGALLPPAFDPQPAGGFLGAPSDPAEPEGAAIGREGRVLDLKKVKHATLGEFGSLVSVLQPRGSADFEPLLSLKGGVIRHLLGLLDGAAKKARTYYEQEITALTQRLNTMMHQSHLLRQQMEQEVNADFEKKQRMRKIVAKLEKVTAEERQRRQRTEKEVQVDTVSEEIGAFKTHVGRLRMQMSTSEMRAAGLHKQLESKTTIIEVMRAELVELRQRASYGKGQDQERLAEEAARAKQQLAQALQAQALSDFQHALHLALQGGPGLHHTQLVARLVQELQGVDLMEEPGKAELLLSELQHARDLASHSELPVLQLRSELARLDRQVHSDHYEEVLQDLDQAAHQALLTQCRSIAGLASEVLDLQPGISDKDRDRLFQLDSQLAAVIVQARGGEKSGFEVLKAVDLGRDIIKLAQSEEAEPGENQRFIDARMEELDHRGGKHVNRTALDAALLVRQYAGLGAWEEREREQVRAKLQEVHHRLHIQDTISQVAGSLNRLKMAAEDKATVGSLRKQMNQLEADARPPVKRLHLLMDKMQQAIIDGVYDPLQFAEMKAELGTMQAQAAPSPGMKRLARCVAEVCRIDRSQDSAQDQIARQLDQISHLIYDQDEPKHLKVAELSSELARADAAADGERVEEIVQQLAEDHGRSADAKQLIAAAALTIEAVHILQGAKEVGRVPDHERLREIDTDLDVISKVAAGAQAGNVQLQAAGGLVRAVAKHAQEEGAASERLELLLELLAEVSQGDQMDVDEIALALGWRAEDPEDSRRIAVLKGFNAKVQKKLAEPVRPPRVIRKIELRRLTTSPSPDMSDSSRSLTRSSTPSAGELLGVEVAGKLTATQVDKLPEQQLRVQMKGLLKLLHGRERELKVLQRKLARGEGSAAALSDDGEDVLKDLFDDKQGRWRRVRTGDAFMELATETMDYLARQYSCQVALWELEMDPNEVSEEGEGEGVAYSEHVFKLAYTTEEVEGQILGEHVGRAHMLADDLYQCANTGMARVVYLQEKWEKDSKKPGGRRRSSVMLSNFSIKSAASFSLGTRVDQAKKEREVELQLKAKQGKTKGKLTALGMPGIPHAPTGRDKCFGVMGCFLKEGLQALVADQQHKSVPAMLAQMERDLKVAHAGLGRTLAMLERKSDFEMSKLRAEVHVKEAADSFEERREHLELRLKDLNTIKRSLEKMMASSIMTKSLIETKRYRQANSAVVCVVAAILLLLGLDHGMVNVYTLDEEISNMQGLKNLWDQISRQLDAASLLKDMSKCSLKDLTEAGPVKMKAVELLLQQHPIDQVKRASKCVGVLHEWVNVMLNLYNVYTELARASDEFEATSIAEARKIQVADIDSEKARAGSPVPTASHQPQKKPQRGSCVF